MSRGAREYMLQMSTIQLKAEMNVACKVVDNMCTFLQGEILNLFSDVQWGGNLLSYDLHKCHRLQSSWPFWKSDFSLKMYWNWTSFSILNNLDRLSFIICLHTKSLLLHRPMHDFTKFGWIYRNVNYFVTINQKKKGRIKSTGKIFEAALWFQHMWNIM